MRMIIGAKDWTWDEQRGLRLYAGPIRRLGRHLLLPDRRSIYNTLQDFISAIDASTGSPVRPRVYSRRVLVVTPGQTPLFCIASFSDNTDRRPPALARRRRPALQGYVTARQGTWLNGWVGGRMNRNITFDYQPYTTFDVLLIL
jgi:hypothetical protein